MAKQTIIVMSDSHGDSLIVEEIRDRYLGKVDAIFHDGDSELRPDSPLWEGIHVVKGNMDFYSGYPERLVTQLGGPRLSRPMDTCLILTSTSKSWISGLRRKTQISVSMVTCMCQMLGWKERPSFKSRLHQSTTWYNQRMSLCSCGD